MPENVLILYDRCRLRLNLPIYFDDAPLSTIWKVFRLLRDRAWQNETAWETLDEFFPAWDWELSHNAERLEIELHEARRDAEVKRRTVAALGSALDERIFQAKHWLAHARRKKRNVNEFKALLADAKKPVIDHQQAVKEVKRLERALKTATNALVRGRKIMDAYKKLRGEFA